MRLVLAAILLAASILPAAAGDPPRFFGDMIGDSIATQVGAFMPRFRPFNLGGTTSGWAVNHMPVDNLKWRVISVGSNDWYLKFTPQYTRTNLQRLKDKAGSARIVWIVPQQITARNAMVKNFAKAHGDKAIEFRAGPDRIHPVNPARVAQRVRDAMTATARTRPASRSSPRSSR